jgi:hypothetical protein
MTNRLRPNGFRPQLETLEARDVPATPAQIGAAGIPLSGAFSTWNYGDGGTFTPSPVFADINGDGSEELITVTGDRDVAAYTFGGGTAMNLLRTFDTGVGAGEIYTTPLVVFVPGIGKVVYVGDRNGNLYGWNAADGVQLAGFPVSVDVPPSLYPDPQGANPRNSILGPLAAGDIDGDGVPEIVATSYNHHVTAFRWNGGMVWRYANDDSVLSGVAIGDLDRDGISEVVLGGDYSTNAFYDAGGNVTALSGPTGRRKWVKMLPQIGQSSPVLGDVNGDGTLEIFVGTGINYMNLYGATYPGNYVYGLDHNGNDLPGWPYATAPGTTEGRTPSPPALADLDGNGSLEVIIGDYAGKIHAVQWNGVAATARWTANFSGSNSPLFAAPVVLDIDGDNDLDVVQLSNSEIRAFDGLTGALTWSGFVENGGLYQFISSPAVGKFKGNGTIQLAVMSNGASQGGQPLGPSLARVFDVDASTTTPQWWASRGDASSNVVRRLPTFVNNYLMGLGTYLGRDGAGTTALVNAWRDTFKTAQSLETTSKAIVQSSEARANQIEGWYTAYLNRPAGAGGVNAWMPYLSGQATTYARVESLILGSVEAINLAGGTNAGWVSYMYQRVLGHAATASDISAWSAVINNGSYQRTDVAYLFLYSQERTEKRIRDWYAAYSPGNSTAAPAPSLYAAAWDLRRQFHEETILLRLYGNGRNAGSSDYLAMNYEGAWLKGMYRDVLKREASQADLIAWLQYLATPGSTLYTATNAIVKSTEHNILLMKSYYRRYLHRAVDPSTADVMPYVNQLNAGVPREYVIRDLMASIEYAVISGGTSVGYVNSVYVDFFGLGREPDAFTLNYWSNLPSVKQDLPLALMAVDEYLFSTINNEWVYPYLRRKANTAANQSALFFTPSDPFAPVRDWINHMKAAVGRQQDIEVAVLVSAEYINLARYGAFWTGKRWKV